MHIMEKPTDRLWRTTYADYVKPGMQTVEQLVDECRHVYSATRQLLQTGRRAVRGMTEGNDHELENKYSFRSIRNTISCQTWDDATNCIIASHLSPSATTRPPGRRRPAPDAGATPHELHRPQPPVISQSRIPP